MLLLAVLMAPDPGSCQTFTLELLTGTAWNFPSPLSIRQEGHPDLRVDASYDTKPFGPETPYYAWRASLWDANGAWEIGQVHHRLFLKDPPPPIDHFAVHFGYNYFHLGRSFRIGDHLLHLNGGVIVTSPESRIRGLELRTPGDVFDGGYYLSGLGLQASVSRNFPFARDWFLVTEASLLAGFAWWVPVAQGWADVPTLGLHGRFGVGWGI
jgi:hypothetical protein